MSSSIERYFPDPSEAIHIASGLADIIVPPLGIAGHAIAGGVGILEKRQNAKRERIKKDAQRMLLRAAERNKQENYELDEEQVDLFFEVVEASLRDDEEIKRELFYDPLVAWIGSFKLKPIMVRPLFYAVRSLSAVELFSFVVELQSNDGIRQYLLPYYSSDRNSNAYGNYARSRFVTAGLSGTGGIQNHGNGTPLAAMLRSILEHEGFDENEYAYKLGIERIDK